VAVVAVAAVAAEEVEEPRLALLPRRQPLQVGQAQKGPHKSRQRRHGQATCYGGTW